MDTKVLDDLYGSNKNPYYVFCPRWVESSAGIKALHFLCHALNRSGQNAFLVLCEPPHRGLPRVNPKLMTPILSQEIADAHFHSGLTPITIYTETVPGNPMGASYVVRYLMNFVGALSGPNDFDEEEELIAFSESIARNSEIKLARSINKTLFLPPIDPREFEFKEDKLPYQVVYAGKYRSYVGRPEKVGYLRSIEIYRDGPKMQSRQQVKKLLSDASLACLFENSSLATEAILSGTPVHFIKTPLTEDIIAKSELTDLGITKSLDEHSIETAKQETLEARERYIQQVDNFSSSLKSFIEETQWKAGTVGYLNVVNVPVFETFITTHRISLAGQILRRRGFFALIRVVYHFAMRRLSWRFWLNREI